jgi:hypothetical protein
VPFNFRLRVLLPPNQTFNLPDGLESPIDIAGPIPLKVSLPTTTDERSEIGVSGEGFESHAEAQAAGSRAQSALRAAGLVAGVSMAFGENRATSSLSNVAREAAEAAGGVKVIDDVHGLHVYEADTRGVVVFTSNVTLTLGHSGERFIDAFQHAFESGRGLSEKLGLAFDLYFLTDFEASERARILTLVTALEVVADRRPRTARAHEIVNRAIADAETASGGVPDSATKADLRSLIGYLRDARNESITASVVQLVTDHVSPDERYLDRSPQDFAKHCYLVRSKLIHTGNWGTEAERQALSPQLRRLVAEVIKSMAGISRQ